MRKASVWNLIILIAILLSGVESSSACSCVALSSDELIEAAVNNTDVIIIGKAGKYKIDSVKGVARQTFRVVKVLKPNNIHLPKSVVISVDMGQPGMCGTRLEAGKRYVVSLYGIPGHLVYLGPRLRSDSRYATNICALNFPASNQEFLKKVSDIINKDAETCFRMPHPLVDHTPICATPQKYYLPD